LRLPPLPDGSTAPRKEVRVSLRTKDKQRALYLARKRWVAMNAHLEDAMLDSQANLMLDKYAEGKALLARIGVLDPNQPYTRNKLQTILSPAQLDAYTFAYQWLTHRNNPAPDPTLPYNAQPTNPNIPIITGQSNINDISLKDAIARYLKCKVGLVPKTLEIYANRLGIFCKILTERNGDVVPVLSQINAEMIRSYLDVVSRMPKRVSETKRITVLANACLDPISPFTRKLYVDTVKDFIRWAESQDYSIAGKLVNVLGKQDTKRGKGKKPRGPFDKADLECIFYCDAYKHGKFKRPTDYWLPLLGLLTGAREGELLQLYPEDIYKDDETGLWVIDINDNGDKTLKNESSRRKIPIHSTLRKLGFLKFVESRPAKGPLFDERKDKYGHRPDFSKRFRTFLNRLGITSRLKVFHSFRHNVSTFLRDKGCDEQIINLITGHSQAKQSHAIKTYSHGEFLRLKAKWIDKLDWGLDFDGVCPNGWKRRFP